MNILGVRRKYRLASRVSFVLRTIIKHGLGYFIDRIFREPHFRILRFHRAAVPKRKQLLSTAERLRCVIEELGPTYIKIGQFFSTRADILSEDFLKELSKLQDSVSPFSFEEVKKTIVEDFGTQIEDIFVEFSKQPQFSASIGQVHFARLSSGQRCVVKVRRPGIEEVVAADIEVLKEILRLASKHIPELKQWNISNLLEEAGEYLRRQMDFIYEAGMMEKLKAFYEKVDIMVPHVLWEYTSRRVLTMEQIHGMKIFDVSHPEQNIPQRLVKGLFQTLFETGYFHGDLHPGNIMLTDDGKIAFVDFGMVGYLSFEKRKQMAGIISGVLNGNLSEALPHLKKFFGVSYHVPENFEKDVGFIVDKYGSLPLKKVHLADIVYDLMTLARKMNMRLDSEIGLLARNLMSLEAICARINPGESLLNLSRSYWQPVLETGVFQRFWIEDIKNLFISYRNLFAEFPENWEEFLRLNRERVETEQKIVSRLERYNRSLEHASTNISLAILLLPVLSVFLLMGIRIMHMGLLILSVAVFILFAFLAFKLTAGKYDD
ncbi:MAG TPA: AarF/UbiB family protein [bacterium]|nr:AarF/UbiB family protein [bacterium]HOL34870.1 AarF/UbiB family protein [bacterium]HPP07796.1 AarF/UbiB family protein [bacterium]